MFDAQAMTDIHIGTQQSFRNMTVYPLIGNDNRSAQYLLLDEALERGLAEVTEVNQSGSVPTLAFENKSPGPILLVVGDELRGAKQNRVLNLTLFISPRTKIDIPVSCVEQGRWAYNSARFDSGTKGGG